MTEEKDKKAEVKKVAQIELTQVATQTADAFKLPDGTIMDTNQYLVWLGNQVLETKKAALGA